MHYNKDIEQNQLIGYWLKSVGLTLKTLERHPCIDDLIALQTVKRAVKFSQRETLAWQILWNKAFESKRCLNDADWNKLYNNTKKALERQHSQAIKQNTARHKIRQLRRTLNANNMSAYDMTAKDAEPGITGTIK